MKQLDCMGEFCPVPTLKTLERVARLDSGETLSVLVDHSCALENIREALRNQVQRFEVTEVANGIWEIQITKR